MRLTDRKRSTDIFPDEECYELDILAITRTHLSNECTFLSYLRTPLGFISTGAALVKLVADMPFLILGYVLLFSPIITHSQLGYTDL